MNVLYETILVNPAGELRVYVGIHSLARGPLWSEMNTEGYIGSGGVFNQSKKRCGYVKYLKPGWAVRSVSCVKENVTLADETDLIKQYQNKYGIAPECKGLVARDIPVGICVNVGAGSANLLTEENRRKAREGRTNYYRTEDGRNDLRERSRKYSSARRSEVMNAHPEWKRSFVESGHSEESRKKRHKTYVESGNAKRVSDLGNAAIKARARRCILNDGFIGVCSDIVEHTGLKRGSVGAKMSEAFKLGESSCLGWKFKPYKYDTN